MTEKKDEIRHSKKDWKKKPKIRYAFAGKGSMAYRDFCDFFMSTERKNPFHFLPYILTIEKGTFPRADGTTSETVLINLNLPPERLKEEGLEFFVNNSGKWVLQENKDDEEKKEEDKE